MPGASCVVRLVDAQSDAFSEPGPPYRLDRVEEICSALKLKKEAYSFPENDMEANVPGQEAEEIGAQGGRRDLRKEAQPGVRRRRWY